MYVTPCTTGHDPSEFGLSEDCSVHPGMYQYIPCIAMYVLIIALKSRIRQDIWNRDRLYEIMDFGTYMYVLVCTEYIPVRNAEIGTYMYVPVCTEFVQVL